MRDWGNSAEPASERDVTITRVYDAPARLVFRAWSEPEHVKKWFGPEGWPLTTAEIDFRVGGSYRFAMTGPDGKENSPFGGRYLEIVPDKKLVFEDSFEQEGAEKMLWTVTFDDVDGKTKLTLHILFWSAAMKEQYLSYGMLEGLASSLDQLAPAAGTIKESI